MLDLDILCVLGIITCARLSCLIKHLKMGILLELLSLESPTKTHTSRVSRGSGWMIKAPAFCQHPNKSGNRRQLRLQS